MAIINQQLGQEFQKRFKTLPEDIQNALTAVASVDTIFGIGKKYGLMVDQIGKMADEIWKVMLGLADPKDFIRILASALNIESEKASAIASDVNARMFQTVRESLRKMYDSATPLPKQGLGQGQAGASHIPPVAKEETQPSNDGISPMIYPQDRFEESFRKEAEMFDTEGRAKEALEQLAPLVPSVVEGPPPMIPPQPPPAPPPPKDDDFTYPEKTKEVYREATKGRDPYRESIE